MRLQTESKRMSHASHMSVDISRANSLFGGGPTSSKRASFTPLTGSGISASQRANNHRRISSISEPSIASDGTDPPSPTGTVAGQTVSWPGDADAKKARRSSAFFGGMPVNMHMSLARSTTPSPPTQQRQLVPENGFNSEELESLKKERDSARAELATAKKELAEAQEAREASEQCVVALRSFISAQTEAGSDASMFYLLPHFDVNILLHPLPDIPHPWPHGIPRGLTYSLLCHAIGRCLTRTLLNDGKRRDQFAQGDPIDAVHIVFPIGDVSKDAPEEMDMVALTVEDHVLSLEKELRDNPNNFNANVEVQDDRMALEMLKNNQRASYVPWGMNELWRGVTKEGQGLCVTGWNAAPDGGDAVPQYSWV